MTDREKKAAAKEFVRHWAGKGDEKQHTQLFWKELLQDVYGMAVNSKTVEFEKRVLWDSTTYIDVYIPSTRVLIEQKSYSIDLDKPEQRHGKTLTPFEQAKEYRDKQVADEAAKYIITCNFGLFRIYDLNKENPHRNYTEVALADLPEKLHIFDFIANENKTPADGAEDKISKRAGELVGTLKRALKAQYKDPGSESAKRSLTILCVRLVFCMYAEDADIFPKHLQFHDYLAKYAKISPNEVRRALKILFRWLDTPDNERDNYDNDLMGFPFVNGGLFSDADIEIPGFTDEIVDILLRQASAGFDWSEINPTIFGAMFESVLSSDERSDGGMHYTEPKNIHKVIDPLFLDGLKTEFEEITALKTEKARTENLLKFQNKLANLTFLDPACGSGNFLTLSFCELRRLENKVIAALYGEGQTYMEGLSPVKVSISQFYGIEIHDFAVSVAKTALWIAEHQMLRETEDILDKSLNFLPLKSYPNIVKGNALRMDWNDVVKKETLNYIMGNPPFVGYSLQSKEQKDDILSVYTDEKGKPYKTAGKIDYVSGWYFKAAELMQGTEIRSAFVSTNSITQGEQVSAVWKPLYDRFGIHIDFAHRTFIWDSEANEKAHVHVVIVGYSYAEYKSDRVIFENEVSYICRNINPYLIDFDNIFIDSRAKPICNVSKMLSGNRPADGGYLILSQEEKEELITKEPLSEKYIKQFMMGYEFINNVPRYRLWLVDLSPAELRKMPNVLNRVELCKQDRLNGAPDRQKLAETPTVFREQLNPDSFIALPVVSSQQRKYIPMGYLNKDVIAGNKLFIIPDASIYDFGILNSYVHMAWMRAVGGRLKSDYSYSKNIVYNNFPWCTPTSEQKAKIEQTAQGILDARALYPDCSLADLYDETTMPPDLRKAHKANDKAVMQAYGFRQDMTESEIVAELMKMYKEMAE